MCLISEMKLCLMFRHGYTGFCLTILLSMLTWIRLGPIMWCPMQAPGLKELTHSISWLDVVKGLNQTMSVLSLSIGFSEYVCCVVNYGYFLCCVSLCYLCVLSLGSC